MNEAKRSERRVDRRVRLLPAPADGKRVECGPVQFGDDWPGVFIRGDNAAYYAMVLRAVLESGGTALERGMLQSLYNDLRGCIEGPAQAMFPDLQPNYGYTDDPQSKSSR